MPSAEGPVSPETASDAQDLAAAGPIETAGRIGALDLARGFALLGILLINVQSFNLSLMDPAGGKRVLPTDDAVQWLLAAFVENKFWTLFSLLFGMGFAVMLERAGDDRRGFVVRYLRRALALAAFGALHIVLIWSGDVLLNYAVAALIVLAILFCRPGWALALGIAAAVAAAAAHVPRVGVGDVIVLWTYAAAVACYLRPDGRHPRARIVAAVVLGAILIGLAVAYGSAMPADSRRQAGYALALLIALPAAFDRSQWPMRAARAGIWLFMAPVLASALAASLVQWAPASLESIAATPASEAQAARQRAEFRARADAENKTMLASSYAESVAFRARNGFMRPAATVLIMGMLAGGLFLIGIGLVSSGAARSPERHRRLWRGLAWVGFPIGTVCVIGGERLLEIESLSKPVAAWLSFLPETGALLMALGYLAFAFLLARRATGGALSWVAATGRMGLTNYLLQSVLATWFFYGYGLNMWGLGRTWQAVFVLSAFAIQMAASRWWLSRHSYGPMEWLWRWITYARKPQMRLRA